VTAARPTPGQKVGGEIGAGATATGGSGGRSGGGGVAGGQGEGGSGKEVDDQDEVDSGKATDDDDAEGEEDDEELSIPSNIPRQVHKVGKRSNHCVAPSSSGGSDSEEDPGHTDHSESESGANLNAPATPTPAAVQPSPDLSNAPPPSTALPTDNVLPPDDMDLDPAPAGANRRSIDDVEDLLGPRRSKHPTHGLSV
jgi:hypothetical protein